MVAETDLKMFVACWMQLGKGICQSDGKIIHLDKVVQGEAYSNAFESLWQRIFHGNGQPHYLEGTTVALNTLSDEDWEILQCARCNMPIVMPTAGVASCICPCHDLAGWPNLELPPPRPPVKSAAYLGQISQRLKS
jgi:hypothetical protein